MPENMITREHSPFNPGGWRWGNIGRARDSFIVTQAGASQSAWPEGTENVGAASLGRSLSIGFTSKVRVSPQSAPMRSILPRAARVIF